ncbi:MAG: glycosyltransferase family 4 protein [Rhodospirillaceae bacterium]|nr:glycosyltransferase family 4 protein [Rhodospirillaceae bacterium]MBT6089033.1 glycosyltransferase family 4 protein [Rhodospirillaceae bacterium]MBT7449202.1 glycosyltransferase family 4 protein [Rhodospirillaceae bacterium]
MDLDSSPNPRILFLVTESYYFASHKMELAAAAVEAGYNVTVAARCDNVEQFAGADFKVVPLAWKRTGSILSAVFGLVPDLLRVRAVLAHENPDVVHNISLKPAIIGSIAAFGRKVKVINSVNGFGYVFYARSLLAKAVQLGCGFVLRQSAKRNDARIVLQNREDATYAREGMGIKDGQVRMIRGSGIDTERFVPQTEPKSPPMRFLILARLLHMKGIQVAVAAFELLRQQGVDAELVVCGAPDSGNPSSIPDALVKKWSDVSGVTFKGQVADVRSEIAESHVVMLPALGGEGLPRALLEAAAMERPLLATDIGGNREIVIPWETGMLVPPDDPEALASAMAWMASHPADRERLGKAARQKVLGEFSSELIRSQHVTLYQDSIDQSTRS